MHDTGEHLVQRAVAHGELERMKRLPLTLAEKAVVLAQAELGHAEARYKAALEELRVAREACQEALEKLKERRNELWVQEELDYKKLTA